MRRILLTFLLATSCHAEYVCQQCAEVQPTATATAIPTATPRPVRTVTFTESNAIIGNPGIGFQTTRATKAQVSNPRNIPLLHATFRTCMHQLNPSPNAFDWTEIDNFLTAAAAQGQTVQLGVIVYDPYDCSGWLRNYIPSVAVYCSTENPSRTYYAPDWNNSTVQLRHRQFIEAMAAKYNNDPRVDSVDLRSVGDYGEWHHSCLKYRSNNQLLPMPSEQARRAIIKDYHDYFTNKPLVHILDDQISREESLARNAGWRADCWGGANHEGPGGLYAQWMANPDMANQWRNAIVDLEPCGSMLSGDFCTKVQQALIKQASRINTKNNLNMSDAQWTCGQNLLRKLGYRIVVDRVVIDGQTLTITLRNVGIAPNYKPIKLEAGSSSVMLTRIMPNETKIIALNSATPVTLKLLMEGREVRTANNEYANGGLLIP